jgi:hypothetical protein
LADYNRVKNGEAAIIDAFHEVPQEWLFAPVIAPSFEEWLRRVIDNFVTRQEIFWYWMPGDLTIASTIEHFASKNA